MTVAAIVPAAGSGERLGGELPKALRLLDGKPILLHAVSALSRSGCLAEIVVAAPPERVAEFETLLAADGDGAEVSVVPGGATRRESVRAALARVGRSVEVVLVHDAARPLAPVGLVQAVVRAVRAGAGAVVPALPLADTVRQVDSAERVVATLPRGFLRAMQTPQGFRRDLLEAAHRQAATDVTDDAALVEAMGEPVQLIPGDPEAFKVTGRLDLLLAEAVLAGRRDAHVG